MTDQAGTRVFILYGIKIHSVRNSGSEMTMARTLKECAQGVSFLPGFYGSVEPKETDGASSRAVLLLLLWIYGGETRK